MVIDKIKLSEHLMLDFAERTGLIGEENKPKRYLWTDAFAVCNFLGLYESQKETKYLELAQKLIDQVHETLGKWRDDSSQQGWISGLPEAEAKKHPTIGGLRIGKSLPERKEEEIFDETLEWDRDGQYFHYLTKWMQALNRMTELTGDYTYNRWAIELAKTAFAKFSHIDPSSGQRLMYWKMSIDLSRPLVASMGQHDALDGWITCLKLQYVAKQNLEYDKALDLGYEIAELEKMTRYTSLATTDSLGIGGLLSDTYFLATLPLAKRGMLERLLIASLQSLEAFIQHDRSLTLDADYRLGFRELGLTIGLQATQKMGKLGEPFKRFLPLGEEIVSFWSEEAHQKSHTWQEHIDINTVMLATALAPDGYLGGTT